MGEALITRRGGSGGAPQVAVSTGYTWTYVYDDEGNASTATVTERYMESSNSYSTLKPGKSNEYSYPHGSNTKAYVDVFNCIGAYASFSFSIDGTRHYVTAYIPYGEIVTIDTGYGVTYEMTIIDGEGTNNSYYDCAYAVSRTIINNSDKEVYRYGDYFVHLILEPKE